MAMNLWDVARKDNGGKRDRFIARFFGIFSEEIAGLYFEHEKLSKYQNVQRDVLIYSKERLSEKLKKSAPLTI